MLALQTEKLERIECEWNVPRIGPKRGYLLIKRCFDIGTAMVAALVFALPMLLIAILIRMTSSGPAIFRQERLGLNGKPFMMLKFRSMYANAESNGPQWAHENDNRCTPVGRILRKSHLDELPQLWNIFKGEMSFVGPRPERSFFYDLFEQTIPDFRMRLQVKPGLTGLAQVNGGYNLGPAKKLGYDLDYIVNCSIHLDIKCIFKTLRIVFTHEGAR